MPFTIRTNTGPASRRPVEGTLHGFLPTMDRRHEPRRRAERREGVSAQVIGSVDVKLCDVSTRGALIESAVRMLVGDHVTLMLRTATRSVTLPGEVVRSRVSATRHGRLRYETALRLASDCPLTGDELALEPQTDVVAAVAEDMHIEVIDHAVADPVTFVNQW